MNRIRSFEVDHNTIKPGIYISRIDQDITTYDMRTRKPNSGNLMGNSTMHSLEHMFATIIRNSTLSDDIIYFGPMGCQTGFYLLVRNAKNKVVLSVIKNTLKQIIEYDGQIFGKSKKECGNYVSLDLDAAINEASRYLKVIENMNEDDLQY